MTLDKCRELTDAIRLFCSEASLGKEQTLATIEFQDDNFFDRLVTLLDKEKELDIIEISRSVLVRLNKMEVRDVMSFVFNGVTFRRSRKFYA